MPVSFDDVERAATAIAGVAHRTPVHRSSTLDELLGIRVYFKCENFQRAGAFKFRGAYNALSKLDDRQRKNGVLTFSSGNHAQALALAGKILDVDVTVVMPHDAPIIKKNATEGYGGRVILYDRDEISREELGTQLAEERGLTIIPPYDHLDIIAGQGTAVKELIEETGALDYVVAPCGGGGLLAGSAVSAKHMVPHCRVIGAEPAGADDAARSFRSGRIEKVDNPQTIADGARTPSLGNTNFDVIKHRVDDILTVADKDLMSATKFLWERMKLVVEPTGALGLAALLTHRFAEPGSTVGIVLSGGNADIVALASYWDSDTLNF